MYRWCKTSGSGVGDGGSGGGAAVVGLFLLVSCRSLIH